MQVANYFAWSALLIAQNISFTYVSRARNSGSLAYHIKAAFFSNGIWIVSNMVMLGPMLDQLTGKKGAALQVLAGLIYTAATVSGSVLAHKWALRTEKGKSAVGASKKYAQVPVEEWAKVQALLADKARAEAVGGKLVAMNPEAVAVLERVLLEFDRVKNLAETAYTCAVDELPVAATASKIAGATITTQS